MEYHLLSVANNIGKPPNRESHKIFSFEPLRTGYPPPPWPWWFILFLSVFLMKNIVFCLVVQGVIHTHPPLLLVRPLKKLFIFMCVPLPELNDPWEVSWHGICPTQDPKKNAIFANSIVCLFFNCLCPKRVKGARKKSKGGGAKKLNFF